MLTAEQTAKLDKLRKYGSAYEVQITHPDGRKYRIGYTCRKGVRGMLQVIRNNRALIVNVTKTDSSNLVNRVVYVGTWKIHFSGRTQRESIIAGELAWIGESEIQNQANQLD